MYNKIIDPINKKEIDISTNHGKRILRNYINHIKVSNAMIGGGPLVQISQEMLENISIPSAELGCIGVDCSAISLYFLGMPSSSHH